VNSFNNKSKTAAAFVCSIALILVSGCATAPPIQEMSDARQAITVAKNAGAEELAPNDIKAAMDYLHSAEGFINQRQYDMARRDAVNAKASALDALRRSSPDQP